MSEHRVTSAVEAPGDYEDETEPDGERPDTKPEVGNPEGPEVSDERRRGEVAALEAQLRRALSDLDNLRKRVDREMARQRAEDRAEMGREWLAVVDNLERALDHAGGDPDALLQGVRAVRDQAVALLDRLGYHRYDDVGRPFDPARDEAVGATPSDAPPGTVVATLRPGYGTSEAVLRPAAVIVSKGSG